jgi:hypothetical protein
VAYARLVTGSETGTVTVTRSGSLVGDASMILMVIPGAHPSTAPEATAVAVATAAAANPAVLDPAGWAAEDTLWITVCGNGMTAITGTWTGIDGAPTNYGFLFETNAADTSTIGDFSLGVAFRQINATSEDAAGFGQDTSNARSAGLTIAVRPALTLAINNITQGQSIPNVTLEVPPALHSHYDAQAITGLNNNDPVATWDDQTANNRDLTQGTSGNRPKYLTDGINGHPAVQFATDDFMATAAYAANLLQPTTYFVVVQMDSLATDQNIFDGIDFTAGSRQNAYHYVSTTDWAMFADGSNHIAGGTPDTSMHVLTCTFNGNSSTLRVDGTQVAAGGGGVPGTAFQNGLRLGSDPSGASPLNARIGEIQVWSGEVTGTERSTIEADLATKWAAASGVNLVIQNLTTPQTAQNVVTTKNSDLVVQNATAGQTIQSVALTKNSDLVVQGLTTPQTTQNEVLTTPTAPPSSTPGVLVPGMAVPGAGYEAISGVVFAGLNLTTPQTIQNVALTKNSDLVVQGLTTPQTIQSVGLTKNSDLVVQGLTTPQTIQSVGLTKNSSLVVQNLTTPQTEQNVVLATGGMLVVQDATTPQTIQNVGLTKNSDLVIQNLTTPQTSQNVVTVQTHVLAIQNLTTPQTIQNVAVVKNLAIQNLTTPQTIQNVGLTQVHNLVIQNVTTGQALQNMLVNSSTNLLIAAATTPQTIQNQALTQVHNLVVQGLAQSQTIQSVGLTKNSSLVVQNATTGQTIQNQALTQIHNLAIQNRTTPQTIQNVALTQVHNLQIQGVNTGQVIANVGLSTAGSLSIQNMAQSQSIPNVVVQRIFNLAINNIAQAQTTSQLLLGFGLLVQSMSQAQSLGNISLTQLHVLVVQAMLQAQVIENIELGMGAMPLVRHGSGTLIRRYGSGNLLIEGTGDVRSR